MARVLVDAELVELADTLREILQTYQTIEAKFLGYRVMSDNSYSRLKLNLLSQMKQVSDILEGN